VAERLKPVPPRPCRDVPAKCTPTAPLCKAILDESSGTGASGRVGGGASPGAAAVGPVTFRRLEPPGRGRRP